MTHRPATPRLAALIAVGIGNTTTAALFASFTPAASGDEVTKSSTVPAEHTEAVTQNEVISAEHAGHGVISGTVVLDADSSAVENAVVVAVRQSSGEVEVTGLTNGDGEFALDPVEPGDFDVYVRRTDSLEALAQTTVQVR